MKRAEIEHWLRETDGARLDELWQRADAVRREHVGDAVHLRGLIEISNVCGRACAYCGIRSGNRQLERYRLTTRELLECMRRALALGYGTLVLQGGEDPALDPEWLASIIRRVKARTSLAVTLSLGERSPNELALWRNAGADRYLLRFETSDRDLFARLHPSRPGRSSDRIALLGTLRELGYETGSGVMVGLPGQTYTSLARDIELFGELDLDMIGVGPYIAHPATPLAEHEADFRAAPGEQTPNTELMTCKVVALARLVCPRSNIPATTALATISADGRALGLLRGANVIMPNITPLRYRALYDIYPDKACLHEDADTFDMELKTRIAAIGRCVATGQGESPNCTARRQSAACAWN
ncbi:MAG: [FeFe] hydrogenase H-cluster radical SAM maturase HydE [Verrucomicrobia bacterium]|nr:[FeFe] hydrogenase H-cluster radical SAM maturase HydE [Verrucomicrobiota bacterium]